MKTPVLSYCIASPLSNWAPVLVLALLLLGVPVAALDFVSEGEKQLSLNNPAKAVTYLEAALGQEAPTERLLLDLGLAYQRTGQALDAQKIFRQGAALAGPAQKTFWLNLGISCFSAKNWAGADEAYTAALALDPTWAEALLNRANARLSLQDWAGASADYKAYQSAAPSNPQKDKIDQVIGLLDQTALDAAATKAAEEVRKKKDEEEKQAQQVAAAAEQQKAAAEAEAKRQADAEAAAAEQKKQDEILAKIRESLAGASGDSQALSTGPSGVKSQDGDFSLEP